MSEELLNLEINGIPLKARHGAMVIEVADEAGITIPRFCYHEKLSVAANCRMCLVEVEKAPKPLPACATPVMEGMRVFTTSPNAVAGQKAVMEFLLINHPLDCPICDQGGECELQDVAMSCGKDASRFSEGKRVVADKNIGPLVATEMTRCIHCTRCVRFGDEIAGEPEMGLTGRGENAEIGTYVEAPLASELSGNMIDLCPVGALTAKPSRFGARAWEVTQRETVAAHDAVGSNQYVHIRRGRAMRVVPRQNDEVNEIWLSDRDRFSYQGLAHTDRLQTPMVKRDGDWVAVDWERALERVTEGLKAVREAHGAAAIGGLISASATLEEMYLFQSVLRGLGSHNIDHRLGEMNFEDQDSIPAYPRLGMSLTDLESVTGALLVGANLRKDQPLLNHRLRKAALAGASVSAINAVDYPFNFPVADTAVVAPSDMVAVLAGVAKALDGGAKEFAVLLSGVTANDQHQQMAAALKDAESGIVILGSQAAANPQAATLRALAAFIAKQSGARLAILNNGANGAGAWIAGAVPHRVAGGAENAEPGLNAADMMGKGLGAYITLGTEPELDCADSAAARRALAAAEFVVSCTAYRTAEMDSYADVLLPIALSPETPGTFVNLEGRWQSFEETIAPPGDARAAWRVLRVLGNYLELDGFEFSSCTDITDAVRGLQQDDDLQEGPWFVPTGLNGTSNGAFQRIGDVPAYAVDPTVRRAQALQETPDAVAGAIRVNAKTAAELGLADGAQAVAVQGDARQSLPLVIDERVADGAALIHSALAECVGLGPAFGELTIETGEG